MITDWFIGLASGFVTWLVSLFPAIALPGWFTGFGDTVNGIFSTFSGLGAWADFAVLGVCSAWSLGAWVLFASIKTTRAAVAHVPGVGGAG